MKKLSAEQIANIEKNASAFNVAYRAGSWLGKPIAALLKGSNKVLSPVVKGGHQAAKYTGSKASNLFDKAILPTVTKAAKGIAGTGAGIGAVGAGFTGEVGKAAGKHVLAPMVRGYGNAMKRAPIQTLANTAFLGMGGKEIYDRSSNRGFNVDEKNLSRYNNLKRMYKHSSEEKITKEAGILDTVVQGSKKLLGHGGTLPNLLGLSALAALPMAANAIASPSLAALGESTKRSLFPLASRINAEEEKAKKELSIATTKNMENYLGQQAAMGKSVKDIPKIESNLQYFIEHDPIISDFVQQDPYKQEQLRQTMNTVYEFAPDIATNQHAAQSILREAAMAPDGGLHYNTVKQIADAQKTITQGRY